MISVNTLKQTKNLQNSFQISNEEFDKMMQEAQGDIENGRLYSHNEIMNAGLEVLENRMLELSSKEQVEAKEFINTWRNIFEE